MVMISFVAVLVRNIRLSDGHFESPLQAGEELGEGEVMHFGTFGAGEHLRIYQPPKEVG